MNHLRNSSAVIQTLCRLISINSVNPAFEQGSSESQIIAYIRQFFEDAGLECRQQEVWPGRSNLIARLPGRQLPRRIIFEAHCDTASTVGMTVSPFEPHAHNGKLYGRGACDTKAGLAAMMQALVSLKMEGLTPPCEVWVVATVDEEHLMGGISAFCKDLEAAAAIVSEPTELRPAIASKGALRWAIETRGQAAHSSKPHLGTNAITHMTHIIQAMEADILRSGQPSHPLLGRPTCNIGTIEGGVQPNFVPHRCRIEIDRRTLPGEHTQKVMHDYERLFQSVKRERPDLSYSMEPPYFEMPPFETPPDSPPALSAARILQEMNLNSELIGVPFGSHASHLAANGIPTVLLGPGSIDQAHSAHEFVECEQVEQAFELYRKMMLQFV
jgi:acetylornithine deacetylase/succinyl-diaminopimelate desuccinylase-like protein